MFLTYLFNYIKCNYFIIKLTIYQSKISAKVTLPETESVVASLPVL